MRRKWTLDKWTLTSRQDANGDWWLLLTWRSVCVLLIGMQLAGVGVWCLLDH